MADESRAMVSSYGKAGYILGVLLAALVLATFSACAFGTVTGEELNPYTFARREFRYVEIPLLRIQVMPTTRTPRLTDLEDWIVNQQKLPLAADAEGGGRWDLVSGRRAALPEVAGQASVLADYMDMENGNEEVWVKWSDRLPDHAAQLWPRVAWLGQQQLYYHIPAVMDLAKDESGSPTELAERLDALLVELVELTADKLDEAGEGPRAGELRELAETSAWHPPMKASAKPSPAEQPEAEAEAESDSVEPADADA